jgi:4-amino-4-deoxy-L-arabinose transferase-like glycosyltransferase
MIEGSLETSDISEARPRARAVAWVSLGYVLIALAALLPRVLDLGAFLNADEAMFWLQRSDIFLRALRAGDYAATAVSTHPGVTTMWLGSAGILLRDWLYDAGLVRDGSYTTFLAITRLPLMLIHSGGVLLGYHLLRRMLCAPAALLAALLWAADPFVIGYSRMLHVDALAGTFLTLSLLAACVFWHHAPRRRWLILSAICAGLAILSKSPALALLPGVGLIALAAALRPDERRKTKDESGSSSFVLRPSSFVPFLAWTLVVVATIFILWPALWVGPMRAYAQVRLGVEAEGAGTHVSGNFFLGQEDDRPGPLFYPVALALRLTPWTLLGLLGLPLALRRASGAVRRDMAALAGFVLLFVAAMSVFPNKLNRYVEPIFPLLDVLAAVGIIALWLQIIDLPQRRRTIDDRRSAPVGNRLSGFGTQSTLAAAVVALLAIANAWWWHPYGIAAFNQALGGARAGAQTFLIGTGEGMQEVAAWLNAQPDITGVVTVSPMVQTLQPYLRRGARAINPSDGKLPNKAGYIVVYGRQTQRSELFAPFDQFYGLATPLHVVRIHGVDYATIYQAPPPVGEARTAAFGPDIRLRGYDATGAPQAGRTWKLRLLWEVRAAPQANYVLFAHLLGPDGRRLAHVDLPLPSSQWRPGHYQATELPLTIPADAPPGELRLAIGLYDAASGQRLPLAEADALDPAVDGPDALLLLQSNRQ